MKTKLGTRAVSALPMPSACTNRHNASPSRTRRGIVDRIVHQLGFAGAALLLAAAPLGSASAGDLIPGYFAPATATAGLSDARVDPPKWQAAYDLNLMSPLCGGDHVHAAALSGVGGFVSAQAGKGYGHFAMAGSTEDGGGWATSSLFVDLRDPQNRDSVKVNVTIKAFASASEPVGPGALSGASYDLWVGYLSRTPTAWLVDACTVYSAEAIVNALMQPPMYNIRGFERKEWDLFGDMHVSGGMQVLRYGDIVGTSQQSFEPMTLTVELDPSRAALFIVNAGSSGGGMAVIDPIITAHPDNPDVEIGIRVPDEDTGRHPLDGFTAEDLAGLGVDPQPFVSLGFVSPSSPPPPPPPPVPPPSADTTPPTTLASATPGANAFGWNNTPVTVTLGATDNVGGSGIKEVHYSLSGAATDSQILAGDHATVTISTEGTTVLNYFAVDYAGNAETARTLRVRIDRTPPTLSGLPSSCLLWPPDHRLVPIGTIDSTDALSGLAAPAVVTAASNEPENGTGDGDIAPDVVISGGTVQLRAERSGTGNGRSYTVVTTASDLAGNTATKTATCRVPRSI